MADITIEQKVAYHLQEKSATIDVQKKEHVANDTIAVAIPRKLNYLVFNDDISEAYGDLHALTNGSSMFNNSNLKSWNIPLPALTNGSSMFNSCTSLTSFTSELPALTIGKAMFYKSKLTSWDIPLPKLKTAYGGAHNTGMFEGCTSLTSFTSELPALTNGTRMFSLCKIDLASVQNIAEGINDLAAQSKTGSITIGMQKAIQGNEELATALATIRAKGWTVTEQYN